MTSEEKEFIKAAMQGLLSNPEITNVKYVSEKEIAQMAHRMGTATYKRIKRNE